MKLLPRSIPAWCLALGLVASLGACSTTAVDQTTGGFASSNGAITLVAPADRKPAPTLAGKDLDGDPIALSDYAGKTVVINVWASWCGPCREEAPELAGAAKQLEPKGVRFLGITVRDDAANAKAFNRHWGVDYPSINDPTGKTLLGFSKSLAAVAIPTTYVIDKQGRVGARILDRTTKATLIGLVEDVHSGAPGSDR